MFLCLWRTDSRTQIVTTTHNCHRISYQIKEFKSSMLLALETMSKLWNRIQPRDKPTRMWAFETRQRVIGSQRGEDACFLPSLLFSFLSFPSRFSPSSVSINRRVVLCRWSQSYNLRPQLPWYLGLWIWITTLSNKWCEDNCTFPLKNLNSFSTTQITQIKLQMDSICKNV